MEVLQMNTGCPVSRRKIRRQTACAKCRARKQKCFHGESNREESNASQKNLRFVVIEYEEEHGSVKAVAKKDEESLPLQGFAPNRQLHLDQVLGVFLNNTTGGFRQQSDYSELRSFFWVIGLPHIVDRGPTLNAAILALGTANLARETGDQDLFYDASVHYGRALARLRADLAMPATGLSNHTLSACSIVLLYQYFTNRPDKQSYVGHIMGLAQILRLRGPASFQEGIAHSLFLGCRVNIIMASLLTQKKTFLSGRAWRTIPFEIQGKSEIERLVDCMTFLPALRERFAEISNEAEDEVSDLDLINLTESLWSAIVRIMRLYRQMTPTSRPCGLVPTVADELYSAPTNILFPVSHKFPSLRVANMMTSMWSSLIDLYNMQGHLYEMLHSRKATIPLHPMTTRCETCQEALFIPMSSPSAYFTNYEDRLQHNSEYFCTGGSFTLSSPNEGEYLSSPAQQLAHDSRVLSRTLALQVCMSVQYCVQPTFKATGPFFTMYAMKMATRCFVLNVPGTTAHLEWANRVNTLLDGGMPLTTSLFEDKDYLELLHNKRKVLERDMSWLVL